MKSRIVRDRDGRFFTKVENLKGKEVLKNISLKKMELDKIDLKLTTLVGCNLRDASFKEAKLTRATILDSIGIKADFQQADLREARIIDSPFGGCNFRGADLMGLSAFFVDFSFSDFTGAFIDNWNFFKVDLFGVQGLMFQSLPSISTLSRLTLHHLPDELTLELMRRDAQAHPNPEDFEVWANQGHCPYKQEERFWMFPFSRSVWKPGKPEMSDVELIKSICKSQGWKVKGYLE